MNRGELRALLSLAFQRYFEVRDIDARRRRSFMAYVLFLLLWVVGGLLLITNSYGSTVMQDSLKTHLRFGGLPHYFPVISFVI